MFFSHHQTQVQGNKNEKKKTTTTTTTTTCNGVPVDFRESEEFHHAVLEWFSYAVYNQPVHKIMAELRCWDTNGLRNFSYGICAGKGDHYESSGKSWTRCIVEECRRTPIRAFMDDLALLNPNTETVETILSKLEQLMD